MWYLIFLHIVSGKTDQCPAAQFENAVSRQSPRRLSAVNQDQCSSKMSFVPKFLRRLQADNCKKAGEIEKKTGKVSGTVYFCSAERIEIKDFMNNSTTPDIHLYGGKFKLIQNNEIMKGTRLKITNDQKLESGGNIQIQLSPPLNTTNLRWLLLWSDSEKIELGRITFPTAIDCTKFPDAQYADKPEGTPKGCVGAVWGQNNPKKGEPSESFCTGKRLEGEGVPFAQLDWYQECCIWKDAQCQAKKPNPVITTKSFQCELIDVQLGKNGPGSCNKNKRLKKYDSIKFMTGPDCIKKYSDARPFNSKKGKKILQKGRYKDVLYSKKVCQKSRPKRKSSKKATAKALKEECTFVGSIKNNRNLNSVSGKLQLCPHKNKFHVEDFTFDGIADNVFFYMGTAELKPGQDLEDFIKLPYPDEKSGSLKKQIAQSIDVSIPQSINNTNIKWFAVYDEITLLEFGRVIFPKAKKKIPLCTSKNKNDEITCMCGIGKDGFRCELFRGRRCVNGQCMHQCDVVNYLTRKEKCICGSGDNVDICTRKKSFCWESKCSAKKPCCKFESPNCWSCQVGLPIREYCLQNSKKAGCDEYLCSDEVYFSTGQMWGPDIFTNPPDGSIENDSVAIAEPSASAGQKVDMYNGIYVNTNSGRINAATVWKSTSINATYEIRYKKVANMIYTMVLGEQVMTPLPRFKIHLQTKQQRTISCPEYSDEWFLVDEGNAFKRFQQERKCTIEKPCFIHIDAIVHRKSFEKYPVPFDKDPFGPEIKCAEFKHHCEQDALNGDVDGSTTCKGIIKCMKICCAYPEFCERYKTPSKCHDHHRCAWNRWIKEKDEPVCKWEKCACKNLEEGCPREYVVTNLSERRDSSWLHCYPKCNKVEEFGEFSGHLHKSGFTCIDVRPLSLPVPKFCCNHPDIEEYKKLTDEDKKNPFTKNKYLKHCLDTTVLCGGERFKSCDDCHSYNCRGEYDDCKWVETKCVARQSMDLYYKSFEELKETLPESCTQDAECAGQNPYFKCVDQQCIDPDPDRITECIDDAQCKNNSNNKLCADKVCVLGGGAVKLSVSLLVMML